MITLVDLSSLMFKGNFESVRVLACDVAEMQVLAGNGVSASHTGGLYTLGGASVNSQTNFIDVKIKGVPRTPAHMLPGGVLEIHSGAYLGGDPVWEAVRKAEELRGNHSQTFALVDKKSLWVRRGAGWNNIEKQKAEENWAYKLLTNDECNHKFSGFARRGSGENTLVIERCKYCGEQRERPAKDESEYFILDTGIHDTWRAFVNAIAPELVESGGPVQVRGYEKMEEADAFAEKHPDKIHVVPVDDSWFSSSSLYLVDHHNEKEFMGTSVVYIPQNGGDGAEFFLYPGHRRALMDALALIDKKDDENEIF